MKDKEYGIVYSSTDYEQFKILAGNRDILNSRVAAIEKSYQRYGWVGSPIIVNEKMEIIDGQGRFTVCKKNGLPVIYMKVEGIGIYECIALNNYQKAWKSQDYINSFDSLGNENYHRLQLLINEFEAYGFHNNEIYGIAKGLIECRGTKKDVAKGDVRITEEEYLTARKKLLWLSRMADDMKKMKGSTRVKATVFAWIFSVEGVDIKRVEKIISEKYALFSPVVDVIFTLTEFSEFYNKGIRNRIYFETIYKESKRRKK